MYSALRAKLTEPDIHHPSYFVGIILKNVDLPNPGHGHVVLGDPSPVLLYPIGPGEVRVLVDVPGDKLPSSSDGELTAYLTETVAP
jgi:squalene monooxygenase